MDSISFGGTVAWAMECFERGLLTLEDTGGIPLRWGDGETVLRLVDLAARRDGPLGDLLADGSRLAARRIGRGTERYAVHIKGLEVAMHDPRGMPVRLENYPVTPTGGDHTEASKHRTALRNSVGLCMFLTYDEPRVVELTRAATGWDIDERELRAVVARGLSLARLFNLREGASAADDVLPPRLHESIRSGPLSDRRIAPEEVREIAQSYYVENGWHPDTGAPLRGTLEALEIADYAPLAPGVVPADERGARSLPRAVTQELAPVHIEHE